MNKFPRVGDKVCVFDKTLQDYYGKQGQVKKYIHPCIYAVELENGETDKFESGIVVLDGTNPLSFNQPVVLEGDEDLDHIVLNGTDGSSSNAGDNVLMETGHRILNEEEDR